MTWFAPRHYRKVGWLTNDVYCGGCGRGRDWPCNLASRRDRLKSWLPIRWSRYR